MSRIARVAHELREILGDLDPARIEGNDALRLARDAAEVARLATTATALLGQRCVDTGVWRTDRHARVPALTPAEWFADLTDAGIGAARDALKVTEALPECGSTDAALRSGELSLTSAREVTAAAEVGGALAEQRVLGTARREGLRAARDETRRVLAQAADAAEREARIHRQRARHSWVSRDGVWNLKLQGPVAIGAEIEACLAPFDDRAWDSAAKQPGDRRDTPEAIAFDGFLALARATRDTKVTAPTTGTPRGRAKTRDHVVVHIDGPALVSGELGDGERCEIPGLGPVPVAHARALVGNAVLDILVEDGRDVRTFARPGRNKIAALAQLLDARDAACTITGCGRVQRIEHDHRRPVREGGDTDDQNLQGLCRHHHALKTKRWVITDQPDGTRRLEAPPGRARTAAA